MKGSSNLRAARAAVYITALYRTDAGNQAADAGTISRQGSIDMSIMPPADRTYFAKLLRNSRAYPIFLSYFQSPTTWRSSATIPSTAGARRTRRCPSRLDFLRHEDPVEEI